MGFFVVGSGLSPLSKLTFGDMKRKVAGVVTRETDDPDAVGAGDAIEEVLREFNAVRWDFLTVQGTDIPLVDHNGLNLGDEGFEGRYTMPTPMRDFVSAKVDFGNNTRGATILQWMHRNEWDRMIKNSSGQGTRFITDFQEGLSNKVELLDPPEQDGRMEVRYYRPITIPNQDTQRMDLPPDGPLEAALIFKAKAMVAIDKGVRQKALYWEQKGEMAFLKALGTDRHKFMHDPDWRPRHELEQSWPARQKRMDFYGTFHRGR